MLGLAKISSRPISI